MDRHGYSAPSRATQSGMHGIAHGHLQPRAALRGPRSVSEPAAVAGIASRRGREGGRRGGWFAMIALALGVGLILARVREMRDAYAAPTIALRSRRRAH